MKRLLAVFLFILSLGVTVNAWGLRIGYVDIQKVFEKCPYTKKATETLNREMEERNIKIRAYQKEIEKLKEDLKEIPALIEGKIRKQKNLIAQKEDELREFAKESEMYLIRRERELTLEITEKIYEVVEEIAKKRRIDIVLNKATVLYGVKNLDLTQEVIEEFEKREKEKKDKEKPKR